MLGTSPPVRLTLIERGARRLTCACRLGAKVRVVWPERSVVSAERGVEEATLPGGAASPEPIGLRELQAEGLLCMSGVGRTVLTQAERGCQVQGTAWPELSTGGDIHGRRRQMLKLSPEVQAPARGAPG